MQFPLIITSIIETDAHGIDRRSDATAVMAEADLGAQAAYGSPEFFFGKLLHMPEQQFAYLNFAPGVTARFRGSEYRFETLEKSGIFKLVRCKK